MREEKITYNGVDVYFDSGTENWNTNTRRPYYRLRGKRVSEEQAFEVIRRCDTFFTWELGMFDNYFRCHGEAIDSINFNMWWFDSSHYPDKFGWVHPNGIVGINAITQKYPNVYELVDEWVELAREFCFLDLVVVITDWDERCLEYQNAFDKIWNDRYPENGEAISDEEYDRRMREITFTNFERHDCLRPNSDKTFESSIDVGVWVHNGTVEIMEHKRAYEKYLEYERLYEEPDPRIYMSKYYRTFQPDIVTREYLYKCLRTYGTDDPEKLLRERTQPYQTEHLK